MAKEFGNKTMKKILMSIMESIWMIKKMDMELLNGPVEMNIEEIILTI